MIPTPLFLSHYPSQIPSPSPTTVDQVVARILQSGRITRQDESVLLRATVSEHPLNHHELQQIRKVLNHLRMGLLKVVD